ncbi:MAG: SMP-30/gluconolactonase/LRE family protein [Acidobacteriia bacterium]|nr:SMP-30/gluconolactonase/LRE family protein [Terriglobia bacterium]
MRRALLFAIAIVMTGSIALAQAKGGPPPPPLMECGVHGDIDIICGTRSPEDLELTPDGKSLIVSQFVGGPAGAGVAGLVLFDPAKKTFSKLAVSADPRKDWGDPACPGALAADALRPHGISLLKRKDGAVEVFVVNHGVRESIEMYELKQSGETSSLVWHGCVVSMQAFNDVAAQPDGGFIATHPTALQPPAPPGGQGKGAPTFNLFSGQASGYVSRWIPGKGESELPGTRAGYPNGVLVSSDGRYMYFNAWTAKEVHKYDLKEGKETAMVKLDFMPDNISWTSKRTMLAAGVKGAGGDCPAGSGTPCIQGFGVAEIDPGKFAAKTVFDSAGKGALISGVSEALQVGNSIYIGAFQGDRIVKIPGKK